MIYTLTLNPAIDYTVFLDSFNAGSINRTKEEHFTWGGKGINVSRMLNILGVPNRALGFAASWTGKALTEGLKAEGIDTEFVTVSQGSTRINVKIEDNRETEINGQGPVISAEDLLALSVKIKHMNKDDVLILSGSSPESFGKEMYEGMLDVIKETGVTFIADVAGAALQTVLKYSPSLIKPNKSELEEWANRPLSSDEDIIEAARKAIHKGAGAVLVSLGAEGAMYVGKNECYKVTAPKGKVYSTIGAGDSLLAGFVTGVWHEQKEIHLALEQGVKCGSAVAFRKPGEKLQLIP